MYFSEEATHGDSIEVQTRERRETEWGSAPSRRPGEMGETEDERMAQAGVLFENFVQASTCKGTLQAFSILCRQLQLDPLDYASFYSSLKAEVSTWKVKALWAKLDKRAEHKVYNQSRACQGTRVRE